MCGIVFAVLSGLIGDMLPCSRYFPVGTYRTWVMCLLGVVFASNEVVSRRQAFPGGVLES